MYTLHELLERLVAIVPRRRAHLTRYFGVFAPAFAARAGIVPSTERAGLMIRTSIARVLGHLGLSADAPRFHPARPPPQTELSLADEAPDFVADAPAPEDFGA